MPIASFLLRHSLIGFAISWSTLPALAQPASCPAVPAHSPTPAESAYANGDYPGAENLYTQQLAQHPDDAAAGAALVHLLLIEGKVSQAATQAAALVAKSPSSASALTAQAEVEYRLGQPALASKDTDKALAADACYAPAHLVHSRLLRIQSMYASERAEIQRAYDIDPNNPDIQRAYQGIVSPANEIQGVADSLKTMKNLDADTRQKAEETVHSMMPLLHEHSQTCQVLPAADPVELPIIPSMPDPKHIVGYKLEVQLPQTKVRLLVDTAASGLYITKAIADENGFKQGPNDPQGTVHVDSFRVGPLEFRDCVVGVSNTAFEANSDGFIGADIFSQWMITLNFREQKMVLSALPSEPGVLPGDRPATPDVANFAPVYRRRQYLLVPITFKDNSEKLFVVATGMFYSAMTADAAHSVSNMKVNFTNGEQTISGAKIQVYREVFDMQFAKQPQIHQGHILEFDPSVVDRNAGFDIAGMLGLDVLRAFTLHLDYRDGLVQFEPATGESTPGLKGRTLSAENNPACQLQDEGDRSINSTIEARVKFGLDSGQLKPGKEIWVQNINPWVQKDCRLDEDAQLYGHVIESTSTRNPDSSHLSIAFDHADCTGHPKRPLTLRLIGIAAPPDESSRSHDALPTEVSGGGRSVSNAAAATGGWVFDDNLNPTGPPHTVHPGIVLRMPKITLAPVGGPGCSALISATERSVRIGAGAELIFAVEGAPPE